MISNLDKLPDRSFTEGNNTVEYIMGRLKLRDPENILDIETIIIKRYQRGNEVYYLIHNKILDIKILLRDDDEILRKMMYNMIKELEQQVMLEIGDDFWEPIGALDYTLCDEIVTFVYKTYKPAKINMTT